MNNGIWNKTGYEKDWKDYSKHMNFLRKDSPNYKLMNLKRELYMDIIGNYLLSIKKGSLILDAGSGIGRFAIPMAKMGYKIHMLDDCKTNLKIALNHIKEEKLSKNITLTLSDVENLHMFKDNIFDSTFAIELICYNTNPKKILKELIRVTKEGGMVFISVEGKYGSLLSDKRIRDKEFEMIIKGSEFKVKDYIYTKYYTKKEFEEMLKIIGFKIMELTGSHYTIDGIFHDFTKEMNKKKIMEIERVCRKDPYIKKLARVWIAVCKVKK